MALGTESVLKNSSDKYEEGKLGRKRKWCTFEEACKLVKWKPESLNILMEAAEATKFYKGQIQEYEGEYDME